jgi:hypothetical protein
MLVAGANHDEATAHVARALEYRSSWVKLRYLDRGPKVAWYATLDETDNPGTRCKGTQENNTACDEYPMWKTEEGGPHDPPDTPHLKIIDADDNSGLGGVFGNLVTKCAMQARRVAPPQYGEGYFLVVPVEAFPSSMPLCNGPNPQP